MNQIVFFPLSLLPEDVGAAAIVKVSDGRDLPRRIVDNRECINLRSDLPLRVQVPDDGLARGRVAPPQVGESIIIEVARGVIIAHPGDSPLPADHVLHREPA
jgi:hypothetical protein